MVHIFSSVRCELITGVGHMTWASSTALRTDEILLANSHLKDLQGTAPPGL